MTQIVTVKWASAINGNYTSGADWTPSGIPNNTAAFDYSDFVGGSYTVGSSAFTVASSANETIGLLEIGANATFSITGGVFAIDSFLRPNSALSNAGHVTVAAGVTLSLGDNKGTESVSAGIWNSGAISVAGTLLVNAPFTNLYGAGTLTLSGKIAAVGPKVETFINRGSAIAGSGSIGQSASLVFDNGQGGVVNASTAAALTINTGTNRIGNAGTIEATGAGGLSILSNMQNDGKLIASGTGALSITSALVQGGGSLSVGAKGSVRLKSGELNLGGDVTIAGGGSISTTTGDLIAVGTSNTFAGDLLSAGDVTDNGSIVVADHSLLNINAAIYGSGVLDMNAATAATTLEVYGSGASFYETGGAVLSANVNNKIVSNGEGVQLSDYSGIRGAGTIGDGWLRLFNAVTSTINANAAARMTIVADAKALAASTEKEDFNAGTIENTGAGGLLLSAGTLNNSGYLIEKGTGALTLSKFTLDGGGGFVEVESGRLTLSGNSGLASQGMISIAGGGSLVTTAGDTADEILSSITNAGIINVVANSTLTAEGHWSNANATNGILIGGAGGGATLSIEAGSMLQLFGGGRVELNNAADKIVSGGADTEFQNKDNTIAGAGIIGDVHMTVDNEVGGIIDATAAGGVTLNATAETSGNQTSLYNAGIIKADTAAGVTIEAGMFSPGQLIADAGSKIVAQSDAWGLGTATINGASSIEFEAHTQNEVHFGTVSGGTLILDHTSEFSGHVFGMAAGDTIDLKAFKYVQNTTGIDNTLSSRNDFSSSLVLNNGTSTSGTLLLEGDYAASYLSANHLAFSYGADATGGTLLKLDSTG
jgi:hypothetical protein